MTVSAVTISAVRLHSDDNVACLLRDHEAGERPTLAGSTAPELASSISMGHKFALTPIARNAPVIKYGAVIGHATIDIEAGEHVHRHNLRGAPP